MQDLLISELMQDWEKRTLRRQLKNGQAPTDLRLRLRPDESLAEFIDQNGVRPGPIKLAQFRAALQMRGAPALYSQDGKGDGATVHVKLFNPAGSAAWYITEWDGQDEVFCYVTGLGENEWGSASLNELATVAGPLGIGIEIDTHFLPVALKGARREA